ncbi:MAG: hypothetical protein Q9201_000835 [Fulgogasparrea decipioides]
MEGYSSSQRSCAYVDIRNKTEEIDLKAEIIQGLSRKPRELPSLLLWDDTGIALYERLKAECDDYYPSQREDDLIRQNAIKIASELPNHGIILELGSGNTEKTSMILSALQKQGKHVTYYALDVSPEQLTRSLTALRRSFSLQGRIQCQGLLGTYDDGLAWLVGQPKQTLSAVTILWLGNSMGNLGRAAAVSVLEGFRLGSMKLDLRFIIGIDSCRDLERMRRCYDPATDLTQRFLLNGLRHANRINGTESFREDEWTYGGSYEVTERSWNQYYIAKRDSCSFFGSCRFHLEKGEKVLATRSAKWGDDDMIRISKAAGLKVSTSWKTAGNEYGLYTSIFRFGGRPAWISIKLAPEFGLDATTKNKSGLYTGDLDLMLYRHWVLDEVFTHERLRNFDTPGGSIENLCYKDVQFQTKRTAGRSRPKNYGFREEDTPLRDPILYIEGLAFADEAFENEFQIPEDIYNLRVPHNQCRLILPWKEKWRERPIFRDIQSREALTAEERNQSMGRTFGDSSTYVKFYMTDFIKADFQEIVFGSEPQRDLIQLMGRRLRRGHAPTRPTDRQMEEVDNNSKLSKLCVSDVPQLALQK